MTRDGKRGGCGLARVRGYDLGHVDCGTRLNATEHRKKEINIDHWLYLTHLVVEDYWSGDHLLQEQILESYQCEHVPRCPAIDQSE